MTYGVRIALATKVFFLSSVSGIEPPLHVGHRLFERPSDLLHIVAVELV